MNSLLVVTDPGQYAFNPYAVPTFLTAAALLALMGLVLVREGRTQTGRAFALVAVTAAFWQICFSWMYCATDASVALWWAKAAYWFVPLIPAAIYQFTLVVTGADERYRLRRRACWVSALLFAFLMARSGLMFHGVERQFWGFYPRYDWPSVLFVAGFVATAALGLWHSFREYAAAPPGWHQDRIREFTVAFAIAYVAILDYLPAYGVPLYPFGYLPVLAFVALTARAVLRYHLVDVTPAFAVTQIVATVPDALIAYDSRNRIRFANPAACKLLELDERALAGLPVEALIDGRSEQDAALREALARGTGQGVLGGLRNRRGERIEVRLSVSPLPAPSGPPAGAVLIAEDIRRQRAADEAAARALRNSEERFRSLAETAQDAIVAADSAGIITFVNLAAEGLFGYAGQELLGKPLTMLMPERFREAHKRGLERYRRGGEARVVGRTVEMSALRKDGSEFPVELSLGASWTGSAPVFTAVLRDASAHREREAQLKRSEDRFRAIAASESAAVFVFQGERLSYVNPGLVLLTGFEEAELLQRRFWELAPADAQEVLRRRCQACMRGEGPLRFEARLITRHGGERFVDLGLTPLRSEAEPAGLAIAFDVTERRLAEQALAESEQRFRSVLDSGRLLSALLDPAGAITHASEALRELLGVSEEELLGREWFSFVPEHDRDAARRAFRAAVHSADLPSHEVSEVLAAGGESRLVAWNATLLRSSAGEIAGVALVGFDVTQQQRMEAEASQQSYRDPMTGLASRAQLLNRIAGCLEAARGRSHYRFALVFGDVDRLKLVNESLGHPAGDKLLIEVARRLETCVRQGDLVARVGGDEFAVLLEDTGDSEVAGGTAERIHRVLERPFVAEGREVFLTMSVGIALNRSRYRDPEELLRDAQTAMTRGRRVGRARSREFETGMHAHAVGQLQIESDLRRAVERNELRLVYQPVVSLATGEVSGFEALLRWDRTGQGRIPPDRFIGIAEETGLILMLGRWVLDTACAQLKAWQDRIGPDRDMHINVNVSPRQFAEEDFGAQVTQALSSSGASPQGLKLEITESVIMEDPEAANAVLLRLRESGVGICLDDFGTGYSSLSYLTRLPAETLKIDQSFVSRLADSVEQEEMVRAVVGLAHGLKMAVIAEGVETREQLERLRALGCEYVQGFFLARPLDQKAAEDLLMARRPIVQALRSIDGGRR